MTHEQVERERTFALAEEEALPRLEGLLEVGETVEHRMRAVYLDTTDLLLIRHRITLRRREGGPDEGWHVKLPRPDGSRLELHSPLTRGPGRTRVPDGHLRAVVAALGTDWPTGLDATLLPVATLITHRTQTELMDDRGSVVATLCDDRVTALPEERRWRELEVELVPTATDDALLDAVTDRFAAQGVVPADSPSKLARALGKRPDRAARGQGLRPRDPAAAVLHAYLAAQVAAVVGREEDLQADAPDAVHKARVGTRRLRSALRTFDRLLDREVTDPLRDEVAWLAGLLGAPRDAEVVRDRVLGRLESLPADLLVGDVVDSARASLDKEHARAHDALRAGMDSDRYLELTDALLDLLADPPWRARARQRADEVLPSLVEQAVERVARSVRATRPFDGPGDAGGRDDPASRDDPGDGSGGDDPAGRDDPEDPGGLGDPGALGALHDRHETRKRAKAARYGWEALVPALGPVAEESARRWEEVTEALGELQDVVVTRERLLELAAVAGSDGVPSFSLGVVAGDDGARVPDLVARGDDAVDRALRR
ncbi:CHAD domain-containing protein [Ornithinimicrobium sp. W1679]|uniref:CYTH and CHAD domain-containing protein n=1 Tax=unclassified Ornithinimicrobium TaxID=2615080 RepID=UPI003CE9B0F3